MSTTKNRIAGLAALVGIAAILVGFPLLLVAIGANPLPSSTPSVGSIKDALLAPDDGQAVLWALKAIAWLAWAFMALSLVLETVSRLSGTRPLTIPGLKLPQAAAKTLVGAAALLFMAAPLTAQSATAATPAPHTHTTAATATTLNAQTPQAAGQQVTTAPQQTDTTQTHPTHLVKPGESLWSIAEAHLGDGAKYPQIAQLNRDVVGENPGFLEPGWVLKLPAHAKNTNTAKTQHVTVQSGDTLSSIAQHTLGDADRYPDIAKASGITDPDVIDVGQVLTIPTDLAQGSSTTPQSSDAPDSEVHIDKKQPGSHDSAPRTDHKPKQEAAPIPEAAVSSPTQTATPEASAATSENTGATTVQISDDDDSVLGAPWVLAGLTSGGALLAGGLSLGLRARRRAQFRARRPGRTIAAPAPELAPVEMTIAAAGEPAAATVEWADAALRRLAAATSPGQTMPPLAALELGAGFMRLHLSAAAQLPEPWQGTPDHMHWTCNTDVPADQLGPDTGGVEPPYPLLVTIGTSDAGETWLLNLEELAKVSLVGDPVYTHDFARHLAAQLAVNPWSQRVQLDCVGIGEETANMTDRINYYPDGEAAEQAAEEALAHAATTIERANEADTDVSTGRTGTVDGDSWPARMLLLDASVPKPTKLEALQALIDQNVGKSATAIVLAGDIANGVELRLTSAGRIVLELADLDLVAVGLTSDEALGCAMLYEQSETGTDTEIPVDETATEGWESYADVTGNLRPEHTLPRTTPAEAVDEPIASVLEDDDDRYVAASAVTHEDLAALAPQVPDSVRAEVEDASQGLDQAVQAWFSEDCPMPRLTLLGPIRARTRGKALPKRKPYFTELLTFLALRRTHGVTGEEICTVFGIEPGKVRDYITIVRHWLGENPATGNLHLPYANKAPAALTSGIDVYQVDDDLLIDLDLFRRLHLRGKTRGPEGIKDLTTALELVTGRPFDQKRSGGWAWLGHGERWDEYMTVAIADTALIVTTHFLANNDVIKARAATEIAMIAAPDEEETRLCLARLSSAEGNEQEAQRIVRDDICNRSDDGDAPGELSDRTETIIRNHQWLAS